MTESFEKRWEEASGHDASAGLRDPLREFYRSYMAGPLSLPPLRRALRDLLEYLVSDRGSNEADCFTVDAFFCLLTVERDDLLARLPANYQAVIDSIAMDLLDGYREPEMAAHFGVTPELLLARAKQLGSNPT